VPLTALVLAVALSQSAPAEPALSQPPAPPAAEAPRPPPSPPATQGPTLPVPFRKAVTFYGFIDAQYSRTQVPGPADDSATFELRRARIGARGEVTPNVGFNLLFDGADTSLKDAYVALKKVGLLPGMEVRLGQWKVPFGYEQLESDTKLLWVNSSYAVAALSRSTATTSLFANGDSRDLGAGLFGSWSSGAVGAELATSVVNGAGPNRRDDLDGKNFWGRAGATAKAGGALVRAGGSFGYGRQVAGLGANGKFDGVSTPTDDTYFWFKTYGGDVEVDHPYFFAAAELIQSERDVTAYTTTTAASKTAFTARGWYAGIYGKTPWKLGPVFRAERYDRNLSVGDNTNERYTVGAYVDGLPVNARLIFNYELDQSDASVKTGNRAILFGQVVY